MSNQANLSGFEKLFLALSDRTRLRLLALMSNGPVSVGYLADQLQESQPKTSRHLAYLRTAGLVSTQRDGKWVYYQLETQSDPAVGDVLSSTLGYISTADTKIRPLYDTSAASTLNVMQSVENTSAETYMSDWEPNELEIYLL